MISSERLVLRPVTAETAAAIVGGDMSVVTAGDGWPHADTIDGLSMVGQGSWSWLATLDGVVIGDAGTHGPPDESGTIEIGYGLAEPFRGQGFGNEIVRSLSHHLLARADVTEVIAECLPDNTPSRRALERAGFELTGESPDAVRYRLS